MIKKVRKERTSDGKKVREERTDDDRKNEKSEGRGMRFIARRLDPCSSLISLLSASHQPRNSARQIII